MSNESVQLIYPSDEIVKNAAVSGMDAYKALCAEAQSSGRTLPDLIARDFPALNLSAAGGLGTAPADARNFANEVFAGG